jgi:hypothetical protein
MMSQRPVARTHKPDRSIDPARCRGLAPPGAAATGRGRRHRPVGPRQHVASKLVELSMLTKDGGVRR